MAKILVTGGAGFIGSHLADALLEEGHKVAVVDDLSTGLKENVNKKAAFFKADIRAKKRLGEIFEKTKPEAIFHLAAQASVTKSVEDPALDVKVNVIGTINLLELAGDHEVKRFVFSSTGGAIYGDEAPRPTPETAPENPITPYGMDKLQAERFISFFSKNAPFQAPILRYANVYGPRQDPFGEAGVIAIFTAKMLAGERVEIYGDGEQTRDFVYVRDVVRANLAALKSPHSGTYNIGSGKETSINEIAQKLKSLTHSSSEIAHGSARVEQRHSCLDCRRAHLELDFNPQATIDEGLNLTVNHLKKRK